MSIRLHINGIVLTIEGAADIAIGTTVPAGFGTDGAVLLAGTQRLANAVARERLSGPTNGHAQELPEERIDLTLAGEELAREQAETERQERAETQPQLYQRRPRTAPLNGETYVDPKDPANHQAILNAKLPRRKAKKRPAAPARVEPKPAKRMGRKPTFLVRVDGSDPLNPKDAARIIGCDVSSLHWAFSHDKTEIKGHRVEKVDPAAVASEPPTPAPTPATARQSADYGSQVKCGKCGYKPPVGYELSRGCLDCHNGPDTNWIPLGQDAEDDR